jgi:hypothetical protein
MSWKTFYVNPDNRFPSALSAIGIELDRVWSLKDITKEDRENRDALHEAYWVLKKAGDLDPKLLDRVFFVLRFGSEKTITEDEKMGVAEKCMALTSIDLVIDYLLPLIRGNRHGGGAEELCIWEKIKKAIENTETVESN